MGHDTQEWRAIPSLILEEYGVLYEGSTFGNVRRVVPATSIKFGNWLKPRVGREGYPYLNLSIGGKTYTRHVHKLIAETFHGPTPPGHYVDHKDTNKQNNRSDNLQYMTRRESCQQGAAMGFVKHIRRGEDHPFATAKTEDIQLIRRLNEQGWSYNRIAKRYGKHPSYIRDICIRRIWAHVV